MSPQSRIPIHSQWSDVQPVTLAGQLLEVLPHLSRSHHLPAAMLLVSGCFDLISLGG
jgi:hypothetical protein